MKEIISVTMNISMAYCFWSNVQVEGTCAYLEHNESTYLAVHEATLHLSWSLQRYFTPAHTLEFIKTTKKYICTYLGVHEDKVHLRKGEEEV